MQAAVWVHGFSPQGKPPNKKSHIGLLHGKKKKHCKIVLTYQSGGPYLSESSIILINTEIST